MMNSRVNVPIPRNEPVLDHAPGSPERAALKAQLAQFGDGSIEIPLIIGGQGVTTGDLGRCILPHDHARSVATYHKGNADTVAQAIAAGGRSPAGVGGHAVGAAGRRCFSRPPICWPGRTGRSSRGDDAQPEQDRDAGGD